MPVVKDSIMRKKGRGSYVAHNDTVSGVKVIQWFDNKSVLMSSNFLSVEPLSDVKRWDKKDKKYVGVPCPDIVQQYNASMGGTDLYDMFMSLYKIDHKSTRWYRRVIFWVLSSCVVQSWIIYKRHFQQLQLPKKDCLDLLSFATSISDVLGTCESEDVGESVEMKKRRGRPSVSDSVELSEEETAGERNLRRRLVQKMSVPEETRYDQMNHWPSMVKASNRQRCRLCTRLTPNLCKKCEFYLCITHSINCFCVFYTE